MVTRTAGKKKRTVLYERTREYTTQANGEPRDVVEKVFQAIGTRSGWLEGEGHKEQSTVKQVANAALILGQNVKQTATALGVDRRAVQQWWHLDSEFREAMEDTKQEVAVGTRQLLLGLAESAVESVETKLTAEKSSRVALALLRACGALGAETLPLPKSIVPVVGEAPGENDDENENGVQSATLYTTEAEDQALIEEFYNADPTLAEVEDLHPDQQQAVTDFFAGKTMAEVAQGLGIQEETVRDWLCYDLRFFAVLSRLQFERFLELKHRLLKLLATAVEIVRAAIVAGDARVAMALLRGLGLLS